MGIFTKIIFSNSLLSLKLFSKETKVAKTISIPISYWALLDQIITKLEKILTNDPRIICSKLQYYMRNTCKRESCWLKQSFMKKNLRQYLIIYHHYTKFLLMEQIIQYLIYIFLYHN